MPNARDRHVRKAWTKAATIHHERKPLHHSRSSNCLREAHSANTSPRRAREARLTKSRLAQSFPRAFASTTWHGRLRMYFESEAHRTSGSRMSPICELSKRLAVNPSAESREAT